MENTVESGSNVVLQNLIALNASLFQENEKRGQQLMEMKKKLEDGEEVTSLRLKVEEYEKELRNKNMKIEQLTSKLLLVKKITEDSSGAEDSDCDEIKPMSAQINGNCQVKSSSTRLNTNKISSVAQRKLYFRNGPNDTEAKFNNAEIISETDQKMEEESLLIPLPSSYRNISTPSTAKNVLRPFACDMCSNTYLRRDHLNRHVRNTHSKQTKVKIQNVNQSKTKTGKIRKGSLVCDHCNTKFAHKSSLRRHNRKMHLM